MKHEHADEVEEIKSMIEEEHEIPVVDDEDNIKTYH